MELGKYGVTNESAQLASYQLGLLDSIDHSAARQYRELVNTTVTEAYERIKAYYKDKLLFDEDEEFLDEELLPQIMQNNLDAITRAFERDYGQLFAGDTEYQELASQALDSRDYRQQQTQEYARQAMEEQARKQAQAQVQPEEPKRKGFGERVKKFFGSAFGKQQTKAATEQRGAATKQTAQRSGFFGRIAAGFKKLFRG